ncbi:MAG: hypothetical protein IJY15_01570, partial [Thermoguttaceae bacterium]|nr:hypothetical protein [Thermoguttaceae bacterium]
MHRKFNVATFVNIFIVGMAALTISLFVFGERKSETRGKSGDVARSVETGAEEVAAPIAVEGILNDATLEPETVVSTSESAVSEVADASESEVSEVAIAAEPASVDSVLEEEASDFDALFVDAALADDVLTEESENVAVADASEVESAPVAAEPASVDSVLEEEASDFDAL